MPATLKLIKGKYRTVDGDGKIAKHKGGSPVDGGGWAPVDKAKGERQCQYLNAAFHRKHGRA